MASDSDQCYCFLVGAGCSPFYPLSKHVVPPLLGKLLKRKPSAPELSVRFELSLQIVKDYLDRDLPFISEIYQRVKVDKFSGAEVVHPYANLLALLAHDQRHYVFTTNYDGSIERVSVNGRHATSVFKLEQYGRSLRDDDRVGVFKLHGSVENPRSLANTFDTITPHGGRKGDPRFIWFEKAIRSSTLCVAGYSGYDDMDVVPTLLRADAPNCELHWFHHVESADPKTIRGRFDPACIGTIDRTLHSEKKPVVQLLNNLIDAGRRSADRVYLHIGPTEITLHRFIQDRFPLGPIRDASSKLGEKVHVVDDRRDIARRVVSQWFNGLADHVKCLAQVAGIEALYYHDATPETLGKLAAKIDRDTRLAKRETNGTKIAIRLIALPKIAQVEYLNENVRCVARLAKEGEYLTKLLLDRQSGKRDIPFDPALLAQATTELRIWRAESFRIRGNIEKSLEHLATPEACDPTVLWRQLRARRITESTPRKYGSRWSRFAEMRALARIGLADAATGRENYRDAISHFRNARDQLTKIGNNYWKRYCEFGVADAHLYMGNITCASKQYRDVIDSNLFSGASAWLVGYPILHLADIERIRGTSLESSAGNAKVGMRARLEPLLKHITEDTDLQELAQALLWATEWPPRDASEWKRLRKYFVQLKKRDKSSQEKYGVRLLYAECLMTAAQFRDARRIIASIRQRMVENNLSYLQLRSDIMLVEIDRRCGSWNSCDALVAKCDELDFKLGAAYLTAMQMLSGNQCDKKRARRTQKWADKNGLVDLTRILNGTASGDEWLPIRFPFWCV